MAWKGRLLYLNNEKYSIKVLWRCLGETCIVWWCDGSAQPSGWYCKYIGKKKTIERLSANEEELRLWSNQSKTGLSNQVSVIFTKPLTLLGHYDSLLTGLTCINRINEDHHETKTQPFACLSSNGFST